MPIAICEQRDPKGLYKKARAGQLKGFTGDRGFISGLRRVGFIGLVEGGSGGRELEDWVGWRDACTAAVFAIDRQLHCALGGSPHTHE